MKTKWSVCLEGTLPGGSDEGWGLSVAWSLGSSGIAFTLERPFSKRVSSSNQRSGGRDT